MVSEGRDATDRNKNAHCPSCGLEVPLTAERCPRDGTVIRFGLSDDPALRNYEFVGLIGSGGMGVIYKVRQRIMNRLYALKTLHVHMVTPESIKRFEREAKLISELKHRHIVGIHSLGTVSDGRPYMIMDFVWGVALSEYLLQNKRLTPDEFCDFFLQITDALRHAHQRGILHRDIKPANIMVRKNDAGELDICLLDFGIAKLVESGEQLTKTGDIIGSPAYMSPEQCKRLPADRSSDLYSLGCVMFECLQGVPPFESENSFEVLMKHINEEPPKLIESGLPKDFVHSAQMIVSRLLMKNPSERYKSMEDLNGDLLKLKSGASLVGAKKTRKPIWLAALAVAILALLAIPASQFFNKKHTAQTEHEAESIPITARPLRTSFNLALPNVLLKVDPTSETINTDLADDAGLAPLKNQHALRALYLKRATVSDKGLQYLRTEPIMYLSLASTSVRTISDLQFIPTIRWLDLSASTVQPSAVDTILKLPLLEVLLLNDTTLRDSDYLRLLKCPRLCVLDVENCPNLTAATKSRLEAEMHRRPLGIQAQVVQWLKQKQTCEKNKDPRGAADCAEQAAQIMSAHHGSFIADREAGTWLDAGIIRSYTGDPMSRIKSERDLVKGLNYFESTRTLQTTDQRKVCDAYRVLFDIYCKKNQMESALRAAQRFKQLTERLYGTSSNEFAEAQGKTGAVLIALNRFDEASECLKRAKDILGATGTDPPSELMYSILLGQSYWGAHRPEFAEQVLTSFCIPESKRLHQRTSLLVSYNYLGQCYLDQRRWNDAETTIKTEVLPLHPQGDEMKWVYAALEAIYSHTGRKSQAEDARKQLLRLVTNGK